MQSLTNGCRASGSQCKTPEKWLWPKVGKAGALHLLLGMVLTGFQMPRAFFLPRQSSRETPHERCPAECGISPGLGPTQLQVPKPAVPRVEGPAPASRCDLGAMGRTVRGQEALRASLVPCANVQQLRCPQLPVSPGSSTPHSALRALPGTPQPLWPMPCHPPASPALLILPFGGRGRAPMCSSLGGADSPARSLSPNLLSSWYPSADVQQVLGYFSGHVWDRATGVFFSSQGGWIKCRGSRLCRTAGPGKAALLWFILPRALLEEVVMKLTACEP